MIEPANDDPRRRLRLTRRRLRLTRRRPAHARRRPRSRLVAILLASLGFVALLAYSAIGSRGGVAQAWDTKTISAHALTDHDCDDTQWHFVITQVDTEADAPATIHVTWANGNSDDVALSKFTGGVAHYSTTANLDSTVVSATAVIYAGWSGQFNLSSGPCGTASTPPPSTTSPPPSTTSPPPSTTSPPMSSSAPVSSSASSTTSTPPSSSASASSSGVSSGSAPVVGPSTSPFVPGPGLTGDNRPASGLALKKALLAAAGILLGCALLIAAAPLRRGSHT